MKYRPTGLHAIIKQCILETSKFTNPSIVVFYESLVIVTTLQPY